MTQRDFQPRIGLTLLEVIVAMAIFLVSLVAIWQLFLIGGDRAIDVKLQARTSMVCQSKLAEAIIGPDTPMSNGGYTNLTEEADKDLLWKMEVESADAANLYRVKVWVKAEFENGKVFESHLSQLVLDPKVRGSTLDQPILVEPGTPTPDTPDPSTTPSTGGNTTPTNPTTPTTPPNTGGGNLKGGGGGFNPKGGGGGFNPKGGGGNPKGGGGNPKGGGGNPKGGGGGAPAGPGTPNTPALKGGNPAAPAAPATSRPGLGK